MSAIAWGPAPGLGPLNSQLSLICDIASSCLTNISTYDLLSHSLVANIEPTYARVLFSQQDETTTTRTSAWQAFGYIYLAFVNT